MLRLANSTEAVVDLAVMDGTKPLRRVVVSWRNAAALGVVCAIVVCLVAVASGIARAHVVVAPSRAELRAQPGLARARREVAARERWLASPVARAQRAASQMAFHGLGAIAARRLLAHDYGSVLTGVSANPAATIAQMGHVVRYLNDHTAVVRTRYGLQSETSSLPLTVSGGADGRRPVDLGLLARGGTFVPTSPLAPVSIARDSAGGVAVGSAGLRFTLGGASIAGTAISGQSVFFTDVERDTDAAVAPTLRGAELFAVLRSRLSPTELRYRVSLPAGASLAAVNGGAVISRAGRTLARIPAPTARDAQGILLPIQMRVVGDELVLGLVRSTRNVAYPVLVDPTVITISEESEKAKWSFQGSSSCLAEKITGLKLGEIAAPEMAFPKVSCEHPENKYYFQSGVWKWEVPASPFPPSKSFTAEFYDIGISAKVTKVARGVQWGFQAHCGPEVGAGENYYNNGPLPPAIVTLRPPECSEAGLRSVEDHITLGDWEGTKPMTAEATLSVGAVLISALWPAPLPSELDGLPNPGEPAHADCLKGDPVNCANGNLVESQTDLSVGGRGLGLDVTRTYNSLLAVEQVKGKLTPGAFGYGWIGPYSAHLATGEICGSSKVCFPTVTVSQDNGDTVRFEKPGETYVPASVLVQSTLVKEGTEYIYTLPDQTKLRFNSAGVLLSETERNGNALTMSYESKGRLETVTDSSGRKLKFAYNAEGLVESAKDPMGHTVKYVYESKNLKSVTQPAESALRWQFKYNSEHELTSVTDGRNNATTTVYNSSHKVTSQTEPGERTRKWEYIGSAESPVTVITEPNGASTREEFNEVDLPVRIYHAVGTASETLTSYAYDVYDDLIAETDPDGHVTTYAYNSAGDRTTETNALGKETKWTYDSAHDVLSTTTPDGEATTTKRNADGEPETIERPAPGGTQKTTYKYDSHGDLESRENPRGKTWTYEYDSYGDRSAETDPESDKRTWEYNEDSQETSMVSPRGNKEGKPAEYTTKTEVNAKGLPLTVTDPLGHKTKYTYNADGEVETVTDANSNKTTNTYDADDELTQVKEPNGTVTETGYDKAGQVTSETSGTKGVTEYVRNKLEEIVEVIDPRKRKAIKEYNGDGNLKTLKDAAGRTTTYGYNAAEQLTHVEYSDGKTPAVTYEYNGDGKVTHMKDGTGETVYGYDELDRLAEAENGHKEVTKYEYDLASDLTKITYPGGKVVTRAYDNDDRLEKVTDWLSGVTKFSYDPDSDLTATTFPSSTGDEDKYTYNNADRMAEATMAKGVESLASLAYSRDNDGEVKAITSSGLPGEEKPAYEYDANSRLTKGATTSYEYDAANDPTKIGTGPYAYSKANELESGPGATYTDNEVGQRTKTTLTAGPVTNYGYDQAGNLVSVEQAAEGERLAINDSYAYNGNSLRASQTISGTTSYLAWDESGGLPLLVSDGTNDYIYGPQNLPIEQVNNNTGTVTYLHHDQAGSTRLLTGSAGKVEGSYTYGPYGETTGHTGTATTPLGYDAQYTSADTGLIYMRARVYDPATAQFLSRDPLEMQTREPYSYAADNPLNADDRTGRELELPEIEAPCWWPFCGPPPSAVEGVKELGEGIIEGAEITWHEVENGWDEIAGNGGCSAGDGEALRREGEQLLGRKHGEAARERWREWWSKLGNAEKKAYNKAKGPKPRKGG